jgi:hypothetical protein
MCLLGRRLAMNVLLLLDASWLELVYRAFAWKSVDQIRYNIIFVPYHADETRLKNLVTFRD